ncbi:MAG: hypothetical protein D6713_02925 [Deltaproteobacteria bacterium]|nr:MAG: hypothetical protein D6713_02925 [Deltaproteobacteria bacterium]
MRDPIEARRKRRIAVALFVGSLVLVSLLLYIFVYRPLLRDLARLKETAAQKQRLLDEELQAQSIALRTKESEVQRWRERVEELQKRLPNTEDFENLLSEVTALAVRTGLSEFSLTVKSADEKKRESARSTAAASYAYAGTGEKEEREEKAEEGLPVKAVVLEIVFSSGYRNFARFLRGLGEITRATRVDSVTVGRSEKKMTVTMRLKAYYRERELEALP